MTASAKAQPNSLCSGYFGNNVCIFNANQPVSTIQNTINSIYNAEQGNEFGSNGYALLFQPGLYPTLTVPVGYYTQVAGLGLSPNDTTINHVFYDAPDVSGNNLRSFWRSAENFTTQQNMTWAVSQSSPLRNLHIHGVLNLSGGGRFSSGGFLANTEMDDVINPGTQQQWLTRNTDLKSWSGGGWNMVFLGNINSPTQNWPAQHYTVVSDVPTMQEKPYLTYDAPSNHYKVIVPTFNTNTHGTNWQTTSTIIDQNDFIIVDNTMSSDDINNQLRAITDDHPKALIFTPGQYNRLTSTININRNNTVVLGLGIPVLTANTPHIPIIQTSATGIKISGLLFEAGVNTPAQEDDPSLLQIGDKTGSGQADAPNILFDIYCRIGGRIAAQTNSCITINDDYTIADNLWLWRADHGAGAGVWEGNQANHGLIVNGQFVKIYGLAVEHFRENQVEWYGDNGSVYFYQSELPYIVPTDPSFVVPASFKLEDTVNHFSGYGFGVYSVFENGNPYALSAIETPNHSGISFTHIVTVKLLGGKGIENTIKTTPDNKLFGPPATPPTGATYDWKGNNS